MSPARSFELRESFHLLLLKHLAARLAGRPYAVKGGICLRFFHRSPRMSQDMDLDVSPVLEPFELREIVDRVLGSKAFLASLAVQGIGRVAFTRPKQTPTTQRWKVAVYAGGDTPVPTRVEFSRRRSELSPSTGVPDGEILSRYKTTPFAAQHYAAGPAAVQKLHALASERRYAVRDLFDLHHLIKVGLVRLPEAAKEVDPKVIELAADKAGRFTHADFLEQVQPFLDPSLQALYKDPAVFAGLKDVVEGGLLELL